VDESRIAHFDMPQRRQQGSDYDQQVDEWHEAIARRWQASLQDHLPARSGRVALLVWGDPPSTTARCALPRVWAWPANRYASCLASHPCRCCAVPTALPSMKSASPF
jgi:hypothetical protein